MPRLDRRKFVKAASGALAAGVIESALSLGAFAQSASNNWPVLDGKLLVDEHSRKAIGVDLGGMIRTMPAAVVKPASTEDVIRIVRYANANAMKVAIRGDGHSNFGQTQADGGIVIDTTSLDKVGEPTAEWIDVQPGAFWGDVAAVTLAKGLAPPISPVCQALTIGGVLSVGGLSGASIHRGAVIDHVLELDVVTGKGDLVTCSSASNRELFEMVLGGLGQCGVIVRARIPLEPAPTAVVLRSLVYRDLGHFLKETAVTARAGHFSAQQGLIGHGIGGTPIHAMTYASFQYEGRPADFDRRIAELRPDGIEAPETISYAQYLNRSEAQHLLQLSARTLTPGMKSAAIPAPASGPLLGLTAWVPASGALAFFQDLADIGRSLPEAPLEPGAVKLDAMVYPFRPGLMKRPLLKVPREEIAFTAFLERRAVDYSQAAMDHVLAGNRALLKKLKTTDGKRYPSQAGEPLTQVDWPQHYGEIWRRFTAAKQTYDPRRILSPGLHMFG